MLAKLLLWVCLLSLNQDIHTRYSIGNVGRLLIWVCLLSLNQDIHTSYNIGNVGKTASMYANSLNQDIHTRYIIGNVGKTASMSMLTLFESRYTLNNQPVKVSAYYIVLFLIKYWVWICIEIFCTNFFVWFNF